MLLALLSGCVSNSIVETSAKSQLELREMQSSAIDSTDVKFITKMLIQVLQDDNYKIENLDSDIGYFTARKNMDGGKEKYKFAFYDIYYPIAIYKFATLGRYINEINATVTVRVYDESSKIRASFILQTSKEDGEVVAIKTIDDFGFYQAFFAKVDKSIFLEKHNL